MATSSFEKKLAKIEKSLKDLKMSLKIPTKNKKINKIDECTTKKELEKFKVKELISWLKKNRVDTKKVTKKVKATWVKLVFKNLENSSSEDSSDSDSSDSDSDSSDSDSDSESSDSDSDSD